jgi:hypothetical protein
LLGLPVDRRRRNRCGNWMSALDGFTLALGRFGIVIAPVLPFASIRKGCDCGSSAYARSTTLASVVRSHLHQWPTDSPSPSCSSQLAIQPPCHNERKAQTSALVKSEK